VVECLLCKYKALSSNQFCQKKKKSPSGESWVSKEATRSGTPGAQNAGRGREDLPGASGG
jgi:hypothetical protein